MKATPEVADRIRNAATSDRRSPLYLWMVANFDEFAASVAEAGRPNWQKLAVEFASLGLTDLKGKPPTPEGARQTWWTVRKVRAAKAAKQAGTARRIHQPTPGVPAVTVRAPTADDEPDDNLPQIIRKPVTRPK